MNLYLNITQMQYQGKTFVAITIVTCACSLGIKVNIKKEDPIVATEEGGGRDEHTLRVRGATADWLFFFLSVC